MADDFRNLGLRHFQSVLDDQNIAWLEINVSNSSVNRLSLEVLQELDRALDYFCAAPLRVWSFILLKPMVLLRVRTSMSSRA